MSNTHKTINPATEDELFGPVTALIKVKDVDEAMRVANDSIYGLGGGIFSSNEDEAVRLARDEFDTGMVNVNGYNLALPLERCHSDSDSVVWPEGCVKEGGQGMSYCPQTVPGGVPDEKRAYGIPVSP